MKKYHIKPPRRKSKRFCTKSTSYHRYTNLIKDWCPVRPSDLWCSDVSFIPFQGKWWYLATIVDIVTRQIIACQVGKHHDSKLILTTIEQAISKTKTIPVIFHTDQGTEFMAHLCTNFLENLGTTISTSDKASPWQNGYQESFFGRFKDEFGDFSRFETIGELSEEIYSQIHYYNTQRIHRSLKMSPLAYAKILSENSPPV
ncbi:MAG: IS3 family transposase [bacterium]|nr:IS3 family transposase [bacterium]